MQETSFQRTVRFNEDVKRIIRISRKINVAALNATLIATKSGQRVRGFGVASSELRGFSKALTDEMISLGAMVFSLVADMATLQKQTRISRHFNNACTNNSQAQEYLSALIARLENKLQKTLAESHRKQKLLGIELDKAIKRCALGQAVTRCAKIESVYGGALTTSLKQVSDEMDTTISDIFSILKPLRKELSHYEKN